MNNKNLIIAVIITVIVAGGGGYYAGMKFGGAKASTDPRAGRSGQFGAGAGARVRGGGYANGEIIKKDDQSITIKSTDGSSKIVFIGEKTTVSKSVDGSKTDLEVGKTVMVNGTTNTDGSVTAQMINLRPAMPAGGTPGQDRAGQNQGGKPASQN